MAQTFFETIQNNDLLKVVLILGALYIFMSLYNQEGLDNISTGLVPVSNAVNGGNIIGQAPSTPPLIMTLAEDVVKPAPSTAGTPVLQNEQQAQVDKIVAGSAQLNAEDLLPKYDDASEFAKENPVGKLLSEQNFLQSGYHIGINSQLESNKIAYLDLRSMPPIPKAQVGPFMNSSYEQSPGSKRRFMEIL
jgi:hypothetical protein